MTSIREFKAKDGSIRYGMAISGTEKRSIRTFPTRDEAVAFADGPISAQVPYKRSFAAAHAANERARQTRRELRVALLGLALETSARMSELFFAKWKEIDLERRVWMIPATYSRGRALRTVPLTRQAVLILRSVKSSGEQDRSRVFDNAGAITSIASTFPSLMEAMGLPYTNFTELRYDAAIRMQKRQTTFSASELSRILDRGLPGPHAGRPRTAAQRALPEHSSGAASIDPNGETHSVGGDGMSATSTEQSIDSAASATHGDRPLASSRELRGRARMQFFELALETCANRRELVLSEWQEFDLNDRIWTVPKSHARGERSRVTPLTTRAIEILRELRDRSYADEGRIFPILLGGTYRRACFVEAMRALGLGCESYFDLRRVARQRFETAHPQFSPAACCSMLGYRR